MAATAVDPLGDSPGRVKAPLDVSDGFDASGAVDALADVDGVVALAGDMVGGEVML